MCIDAANLQAAGSVNILALLPFGLTWEGHDAALLHFGYFLPREAAYTIDSLKMFVIGLCGFAQILIEKGLKHVMTEPELPHISK